MFRSLLPTLLLGLLCHPIPVLADTKPAKKHSLPYRDLTGQAEDFRFVRQWRSYYWREDFTFILRTPGGKAIRVISREPTPWNDLRLGTTLSSLKVDWKSKPRVQVIGVQGIDRIPVEFPDLKLDAASTVTAFIVRIEMKDGQKKVFKDYYVNNWFHPWGDEADRKMLGHFAGKSAPYTVYGFVGSNVAPFDRASQKILEKFKDTYSGIIYHAQVIKADNKIGNELKILHLMGRHKKSLVYEVFHGDAKKLVKLDQKAPKKK